jgi:hypothetical protein
MDVKLPKWPERLSFSPDTRGHMHFERARAEAAIARLKVAVKALRAVSDEARSGYYDGPGLERFVEIRGLAEEALAQIEGK